MTKPAHIASRWLVLLIALAAIAPAHAAAKFGVYQGAGCDGTGRMGHFTSWLGRDPDVVLEFLSWQVLEEGSTWAVRCWQKAGRKDVVFSMPMLPGGNRATLADGAAGKFDDLFSRYGAELVKTGYANSVIRIGWEFNYNWYAWAASKDPQGYAAYWRRIVKVLRDVPGAKFKFDWCPAAGGSFKIESAYPGDDVVDIIGMDFYNVGVNPNANTPEERWDSRMNMKYGLKWHRDFAAQHGKPMSYPEWGTGKRKDGKGGGDDPYFIEQMAKWIASNNVAYANYWDYTAKDFNAKLSDEHQPEASKAFRNNFGGGSKNKTKPQPPVMNPPQR